MRVWAIRISVFVAVGAMFVAAWLVGAERKEHEPVWHPDARIWPSVPLQVTWVRDFWGGHNKSFEGALEAFNDAVGCELLVEAEGGEEIDILIASANGEPCDQMGAEPLAADDAGGAWYCPGGRAEVQIAKPGNITQSYLITFHELGHTLGLAHDGYVPIRDEGPTFVSVMADNAPEHVDRLGQGRFLPALSEKDADALRQRYCEGPTN